MSWPNHGLPYSAGAFKNSRVLSASMRVRSISMMLFSMILFSVMLLSMLSAEEVLSLSCSKAQAAGHLKKHREAESFPHRFDISYAKAH